MRIPIINPSRLLFEEHQEIVILVSVISKNNRESVSNQLSEMGFIKDDNFFIVCADLVKKLFRFNEIKLISPIGIHSDVFGNRIIFGNGCRGNFNIGIVGINNIIEIEEGVSVAENLTLTISIVLSNSSKVKIGKESLFRTATIGVTSNSNITIGEKCMFAPGIIISGGITHLMFDLETGNALKTRRDIVIGNHVWVGQNATVFGNSVIGDGSIVGYGAIVTRKFPNNVSVAGNPAKIVRRNVCWDIRFIPESVCKCLDDLDEYNKIDERYIQLTRE